MSCRSGPSEMGDKRFQVCTLGLFAVELFFFFFNRFIYLFIYFYCAASLAAYRLSLVAVNRGYSLLQWVSFSLQ